MRAHSSTLHTAAQLCTHLHTIYTHYVFYCTSLTHTIILIYTLLLCAAITQVGPMTHPSKTLTFDFVQVLTRCLATLSMYWYQCVVHVRRGLSVCALTGVAVLACTLNTA
jgi:hypothetical protein